jgi:hypothetical protein
MNPTHSGPLTTKPPGLSPLTAKPTLPKEYQELYGEYDYKDPDIRQAVDAEIEWQGQQAAQKVRDLSMTGKDRPIWEKIMAMRGEMMEAKSGVKFEEIRKQEDLINQLEYMSSRFSSTYSGKYSVDDDELETLKDKGLDSVFQSAIADASKGYTDRTEEVIGDITTIYTAIKEGKKKQEIKIGKDIGMLVAFLDGEIEDEMVDDEREDIDDGKKYLLKNIFEGTSDILGDLPYKLKRRRTHTVQYDKELNDEGELDYVEDEDGEDYYPDDEYFLVRK